MDQGTLSTFNQPTTDLGLLMRRQRRGNLDSNLKNVNIIAELWLEIILIFMNHFLKTEMAKFNNIIYADLIETPTTYEVHCGELVASVNDENCKFYSQFFGYKSHTILFTTKIFLDVVKRIWTSRLLMEISWSKLRESTNTLKILIQSTQWRGRHGIYFVSRWKSFWVYFLIIWSYIFWYTLMNFSDICYRTFGNVSRCIRLPKDADIQKVKTDYTSGVLNVTFHKKEDVTLKRKLQVL